MPGVAFTSTKAETRSGREAARSVATNPPSAIPTIAVRSAPAASRTASASPIHRSRVGGLPPATGSDIPVPRRSKRMTRAKVSRRRRNRANDGSSSMEAIGSLRQEPGGVESTIPGHLVRKVDVVRLHVARLRLGHHRFGDGMTAAWTRATRSHPGGSCSSPPISAGRSTGARALPAPDRARARRSCPGPREVPTTRRGSRGDVPAVPSIDRMGPREGSCARRSARLLGDHREPGACDRGARRG